MPLIQDIVPRGGRRDKAIRTTARTVRQVHQATQLRNIPQSFDMVQQRRPPMVRPVPRRPTPPAKSRVVRPSIWRRLSDFAQYPLIAIVAIACAYSTAAGQAFIGLYFLFALVLRIDSRYTFGAALLMLVSIPGFQIIHQSGVSEKAAIYTYELLVAGTLQAIVEQVLAKRKPVG